MGHTLTLPSLPMTPEDFDQLPDVEGLRFELVEGNLLVINAAYVPWHGKMIYLLLKWFERQERPAYPECGLKLGNDRRTCDIGVFNQDPPLRVATHPPTDLATVVEVVSEESQVRDHFDKVREYASAQIPEYWIVDDDPDSETDGVVSMFRLELTGEGARYLLRRRMKVTELLAGDAAT